MQIVTLPDNMTKQTLVLGATLKPNRYANIAIHRLTTNRVPTKAFGLKEGIVAGVIIDTQLIKYADIHTITLYLNPKRQVSFYTYILSLKPMRVIFNPGTENYELMALLKENKIAFEIACTLTLLATGQY